VGLGLVNIRERLDVWTGGRFRLDVQALKAPQVGTRVLLMVPLTLSTEHV
jgi:sensor histidine kinase YesM